MTFRMTQDDNRKKDEAQYQQLQQQIDELRRIIREQTGRHTWNEEQNKQLEARIVGLQTLHDQQLQDITLTFRARQAEDQRMKRQISELEQRIDEPLKPIRDIKAQLTELADQRKKERDVNQIDKKAIDDINRQIREFQAQISSVQDQYRQSMDRTRDLEIKLGQNERETQRVGEQQRIEEQRARRDAVELNQRVEETKLSFVEATAKVQRLEELRKQDVTFVEEQVKLIPPLYEEDRRLNDWVTRVETNGAEKQQIVRERIEEVRREIELQLSDIRTTYSQQIDRLNNRIMEVDSWCRELEGSILGILPKLDELYQADDAQADEMQRLEEENMRVQIEDFQRRYDEVRRRRLARSNNTPAEPLRPRMIHNDPEEGGFVER